MAFPRKYTPDFIADALIRVESARTSGRRGPITAVARDLHIDRRLLQDWVGKARADATPPIAPPAERTPVDEAVDAVVLPDRLLHCRDCQQPMTAAFAPAGLVYDCPPPCHRQPLDAVAVARTLGDAVLRHAAHIVPALTQPRDVIAAAAHAHRVIARVTAGHHPADLRITWHPAPDSPATVARRLRAARDLIATDPGRAHATVRDILRGVDPTSTAADSNRAEAAHLLAELLVRRGQLDTAIRWVTYAHHSLTHLHGSAAPAALAAAHTLATAHRQAGHHQRAYGLYRQLADHLTDTAGAHAHHTLAIRATIALVLRDLGHCGPARTMLADTIAAHGHAHPDHPATARMIEHLRHIEQDCAARNHTHAVHAVAP